MLRAQLLTLTSLLCSSTLNCQAPSTFDVCVVDQKGEPVRGVPVRITYTLRYGTRKGPIQRTGKDGKVDLAPPDSRLLRAGSASVEAVVPTKEHVLAGLESSRRPIRLTLPAFGSVRVFVVDDDQRPVKTIQDVWIESRHQPSRRESKFHADEVVEDYATFRFVEVGFDFTARCKIGDRDRPQSVRGAGPRWQHEMRTITLEGVKPPPLVTCALEDQSGQLVRNEEVGILVTHDGHVEGFTNRTDPEGRLRFSLPDLFNTASGKLFLVRRGPGPTGRGAAHLTVKSALQLAPANPVQLEDEEILLAGVATDRKGQPAENLRLRIPTGYHGAGKPTSFKTTGDRRFFVHELRTGADGRFEFRELDTGRKSLNIQLPFFPGRGDKAYEIIEGQESPGGTATHRLVLSRLSTIRGAFTGLGPQDRFRGNIELSRVDGKRVRPYVILAAGGSFEMLRIPPGKYHLSFSITGEKKPFLTVSDLEIGSGEVNEDPRIQDIDLRNVGKRIRIHVVSPSGKPLVGFSVHAMGGGTTQMLSTDVSGQVIVQIPKGGTRISVHDKSRRFRPQYFPGQKTDLKITMEPTWPLELAITNLPRLPKNLRLAASFKTPGAKRPRNAADSGSGFNKHYVNTEGKLTFRAEDPGLARIRIWPHYKDDQSIHANRGGPNITVGVEINARSRQLQRFAIKLDDDTLAVLQGFIDEAEERARE